MALGLSACFESMIAREIVQGTSSIEVDRYLPLLRASLRLSLDYKTNFAITAEFLCT